MIRKDEGKEGEREGSHSRSCCCCNIFSLCVVRCVAALDVRVWCLSAGGLSVFNALCGQ